MNRVLIVDDEQGVLEALSAMVGKCGYIPIKASSAEQALEFFYRTSPGIVITDLRLGGDMDGVALCSKVMSEDRGVSVIAMSGHFNVYDKVYCSGVGFIDFLQKPIRMADLTSALQCAFDRRRRWMEI